MRTLIDLEIIEYPTYQHGPIISSDYKELLYRNPDIYDSSFAGKCGSSCGHCCGGKCGGNCGSSTVTLSELFKEKLKNNINMG